MHTTCALAPAQKTITTHQMGIRHAIEKMGSKVAFSKLMNARQAECISFESVVINSVEDLLMGSRVAL